MIKKILRILAYVLLGLLILALLAGLFYYIKLNRTSTANLNLLGPEAPVLVSGGYEYRDLNKNGQLDVYEDKRRDFNERIEDLINQMNLEEKAGMMFITMAGMNPSGDLHEGPVFGDPMTFFLETNSSLLAKKKMNHINLVQATSPEAMLEWHNKIQKLGERSRLGIPITIASDPRHSAHENAGASIPTPFFSKWPSPLGFAAIGDSSIVREFGDIARQEYKALGIRLALSPMADLATEPRWGRVNGTFGEDAYLSAKMTEAYILGFQGDSLDHNSVACMTKHFSGGGPQEDGEDAHFPYGKNQVYDSDNFEYHLIPFEKGAFPAKTAQIMPYYGVPVGQTTEEVAFGFNKDIITGLLRNKYKFEGVVCTDWGLITDSFAKPAAAFGVEHLSEEDRVAKSLNAGCDMFGGEATPDWIVSLVKSGKISEERINVSLRRILKDKFRLGLFDSPYLDAKELSVFGNETYAQKGREAQRKSLVLLKNDDRTLPLKRGSKVYVEGMILDGAYENFEMVDSPEDADFIVMKLKTPYDPRSKYFLERFFNQGRLYFTDAEKSKILAKVKSKPTITVMNLERPAVIPDINKHSKAVIADFDCSDEVIMELIFGEFEPSGKMPFELPSSAAAVEAQKEDAPYDSENPLYPFGYGLMSF